jgi:hypothetical protein
MRQLKRWREFYTGCAILASAQTLKIQLSSCHQGGDWVKAKAAFAAYMNAFNMRYA